MNLTQAANFLKINSTTLRIAFEHGEILPDIHFPADPGL